MKRRNYFLSQFKWYRRRIGGTWIYVCQMYHWSNRYWIPEDEKVPNEIPLEKEVFIR
jgi:hypothetical protein